MRGDIPGHGWMLHIILLSSVLVFFPACKKGSRGSNDVSRGIPIVTPKGQPIGIAASKIIGPGGGSLNSPDGKLTITVPSGAVATATEFSIQPIVNTVNDGRPAYRLLPEGTNFATPVQLTYQYANADLINTAEDLMVLFFQTAEGTWQRMPTAIDKTRKLLTVSTSHFSDWIADGVLKLEIKKKAMSGSETSDIRVAGAVGPSDETTVLAYLVPKGDYIGGFINKIGNWKVLQGPGAITGKTSSDPAIAPEATYRSPTAVSQSETVTIQVEIEGDFYVEGPGRDIPIKKIFLLGEINLMSDVYMLVDFEGTTVTNQVTAVYGNGTILIGGNSPDLIISLRANGNAAAAYPCGGILDPMKSNVTVSVHPTSPSNKIYISNYVECGPPPIEKYSPGSVKITKWGAVGETVEGEFTGTVYTPLNSGSGCPQFEQKNLRVKFRTNRLQ